MELKPHLLALLGVADDAARHDAGHLAQQNALAAGEQQAHLGALVEFRFGIRRTHE